MKNTYHYSQTYHIIYQNNSEKVNNYHKNNNALKEELKCSLLEISRSSF